MGLHTIDIIRRDAAEEKIHFGTEHSAETNKAKIFLTSEENQIAYTIDMEKDVIESITFTGERMNGELNFSYLQNVSNAGYEFSTPDRKAYRSSPQSPAMLWLLKLQECVRNQ